MRACVCTHRSYTYSLDEWCGVPNLTKYGGVITPGRRPDQVPCVRACVRASVCVCGGGGGGVGCGGCKTQRRPPPPTQTRGGGGGGWWWGGGGGGGGGGGDFVAADGGASEACAV